FHSSERYSATSTGKAQGRWAKGNWTRIERTTHLWPQRQAVNVWEERTGSRWRALPKTLHPGCSSTVSSPASATGPWGTEWVRMKLANAWLSPHSVQRRWEKTRW